MNGPDRDQVAAAAEKEHERPRLLLPSDLDDGATVIAASPTVLGQQSVPWTPAVQDDQVVPNLAATHPRHWKYISEGGATIVFSYRGPAHPVFSHSVVRLRKKVRTLEDIAELGIGNSEVVDEQGAIVKPLEIAEDAEQQKVRVRGSNESLRSVRSAHSSRSLLLQRSNSMLHQPWGELNDSESDSDWEDIEEPGVKQIEQEQPDDPTIEFQTRVTSRLVPLCYLPRLESARVGRRWVEELARIGERARPEARRRVDGIDVERRKGVLADDLVGWDGWAVEIKVCFFRWFVFRVGVQVCLWCWCGL
ncbi:Inositol-pentakisphosphate 2-kinase [Ceratobasidium sp. 428]|nr:Inositol-pentakisphosphate 2-kinase [Ceratobasidium sp. 428]